MTEISFKQFLEDAGRVPEVSTEGSKIVEFFTDKTVLVTGATGFLGKLLVEKILRVCPGIDRVLVLVREKKNEDSHTRIDKLCSESLFGPLTKLRPEFRNKIDIISGDMSLPDLGLSLEDRQLITEEVNVIFHVAATIKFNEELSMATAINVRGTRDLLTIAESCKFLHSFVHISTAYSNCYKKEIEECFYAVPLTAKKLIDSIDDKSAIESITKDLVGKWPNNYAFTKGVTENLIKEYEGKLAICVVRPGIVMATYNEPLKSWNDNVNGATGLIMGAYTGVLRSVLCYREKAVEVVPADYVTNCMIAAAYKTALEKQNVISIYNYIASAENKITFDEIVNMSQKYGNEVPAMMSSWYNCIMLNRYKAIHYLCILLLHFLPALILDTLLVIKGQKPKMIAICKKITAFESLLRFFLTREWKFGNGNTQNLWKFLGEDDQRVFPFSMRQLDWDEYHRTYPMGMRTYVLKEDPSNFAQARQKWRRLYVSHMVLKITFKCLMIYAVYSLWVKIYQ